MITPELVRTRESCFTINNNLTLQLDGKTTNIYVNGKLFRHCKYLLLHIPNKNVRDYRSIDSIDEAEDIYNRSLERPRTSACKISPEEEFFGHCSNLQAWAENDYDSRILHRTLAFPLLKRLCDTGDSFAKIKLREEIALRLESGHPSVVRYLIFRGYLSYLGETEIRDIFLNLIRKLGKNINPKTYSAIIHYFFNKYKSEFGFSLLELTHGMREEKNHRNIKGSFKRESNAQFSQSFDFISNQ